MGATLGDNGLFDRRMTPRTCPALAAVNLGREPAAAAVGVDIRGVVKRRSASPNGCPQNSADLAAKRGGILWGYRRRQPLGCESGGVERLVGIDVADAGDRRLVEQRSLDSGGAPPANQPLVERAVAQAGQRVGPQASQGVRPTVGVDRIDEQFAECARVDEAKLGAVVEIHDDVRVLRHFVGGPRHSQLAGHPQVGDQHVVIEIDNQELAVAANAFDELIAQAGDEFFVRLPPHRPVTRYRHVDHPPPAQRRIEVTAHRFDLRQLRHGLLGAHSAQALPGVAGGGLFGLLFRPAAALALLVGTDVHPGVESLGVVRPVVLDDVAR